MFSKIVDEKSENRKSQFAPQCQCRLGSKKLNLIVCRKHLLDSWKINLRKLSRSQSEPETEQMRKKKEDYEYKKSFNFQFS